MTESFEEQASLILAAEDCDPDKFDELHKFSRHDERIIRKLAAHGPVLLRGGRGSGKSALMIAASRLLAPYSANTSAVGIYLSMRYLPLLRNTGNEYERAFCEILTEKIRVTLGTDANDFSPSPTATSLKRHIVELTVRLGKRIVLLFDDAAHIGREASLAEFFDIFRTLSSSTVSCKAAIYPGVTRFGTRFDVYNDATVLDVTRSPELPGFRELFTEVLTGRYPSIIKKASFARGSDLDTEKVAAFLGQAVLGNMRAFVFACNELLDGLEETSNIGLTNLGEGLLRLASNYYWPLIDELRPKLGVYESMIDPAQELAQHLFKGCAKDQNTSALVHRDIVEKLAKPFEMLEYVGFISRREVSRSMKSGGRGARFALNFCNLLEETSGTRLTGELLHRWTQARIEPSQFHRRSELARISLPDFPEDAELGILQTSVAELGKSNTYPYGLTERMIEELERAGINTVGALAQASDETLKSLPYIGDAKVRRIRNVIGQAIWM